MQTLSLITVILSIAAPALAADFAPALEWVTTTGGSGNTSVSAAASDANGNLYVVGSTTSLDFPTTTSATQSAAGGSILVRINLATAGASRLSPSGLPPISSVAASPANPSILYAPSGGQIWKTTDAGATWTMSFQFQPGATVTGLAVDPANASTVYAAGTPFGIQKSVDAGLTWMPANAGIPRLPDGSVNVARIWVQPGASNAVFASSSFGLHRSADGGNSWTLSTSGSSASTLAFDTSALYYSDSLTIFRSTDSGQTFTPLSPLPNRVAVFALAPDPRQAAVLYAGTTGGIYQSSDSGATWNLKLTGVTTALVADPNSTAFYSKAAGIGILKSTDGFATTTSIGPNQPSLAQLLVSGPNLFALSAPTTDAFATKLDSKGGIVYATYLGGSGSDAAAALAVASDGSLYVTGSTNSTDLPTTAGAYLTKPPSAPKAGFVLKLNPAGSLDWATYFPESGIASIAVDSSGDCFIGGSTGGGLPTTPGAYQTTFQQSVTSNGFFSVIGPTSAFVTRFNAKGAALVYSTYVPTDNQKNIVEGAQALVVDAAGNAWFGVPSNSGIVPGVRSSVVKLNATGSAVLASAVQPGLGGVTALALDTDFNVYVAGSRAAQNDAFPATPGAFQPAPQPAVPGQPSPGGGMDAFVAKFDSTLTRLLAATLLGGELPDTATSLALDASGTVIVGGYTDSKAFPLHAPFQTAFSSRSGFLAGVDSKLSNLLFSTYLGDGRPFAAYAAVPDGSGNVLVAGSTLTPGGSFLGGNNGASFTVGSLAVFNKIALTPAPSVRLDSLQNYPSHLADPLSPGEPITALGSGFGPGAQIVVDGATLDTISASATSLVAVLPGTLIATPVHTVQVSNSGKLSNAVYMPGASASPAIYSVDGSGTGQGYILNGDGTLNSSSNPAAPGSAITIFAAGVGQYTITNGYAVTAQPPSVFIGGFYCNGIAARIGPVNGLPGNVYQISVFVPDPAALVKNNPDLKNFQFPPQSAVRLVIGSLNSLNFAISPLVSQNGILIHIK